MDKYEELLLEGKFDIVKSEINELLNNDNDNSRLWYLLFLAFNNNYLNFDKDNINNELAFNRAIEAASFSDEAMYKAEFYFYSNIKLEGFDLLFRYYQFQKYNECANQLIELCNKKYDNVSFNNKLIDSILTILSQHNSSLDFDIQILINNLLFIITKNKAFEDNINKLINSSLYSLSNLNPFTILNSGEEIINTINDKLFVDETEIEEPNEDYIKTISNMLKEGRFEEAKSLLDEYCDNDYADALYYKGMLIEKGIAYETDYELAYECYERAYKLGLKYVSFELGSFNYYGYLGNVDYEKAYHYFMISQNNNDRASGILGDMYHFGYYVEKDFDKAISYYEAAINGGKKSYRSNLALLYLFEKKDKVKSKKLLDEAIKDGDTTAMSFKADWIYNEFIDGDSKEAFDLAFKSKDYSLSQSVLAKMYALGIGTSANINKAIEFNDLAMKNDRYDACYIIGQVYEYGKGVEINYKKAHDYYKLAAENGKVYEAYYHLGYLYYNGFHVQKNYSQAYNNFKIAYDNNVPKACYYLGILYEEGHGVTKNIKMAIKCYEKGVELGDLESENALKRLKNATTATSSTTNSYSSTSSYSNSSSRYESNSKSHGWFYYNGETFGKVVFTIITLGLFGLCFYLSTILNIYIMTGIYFGLIIFLPLIARKFGIEECAAYKFFAYTLTALILFVFFWQMILLFKYSDNVLLKELKGIKGEDNIKDQINSLESPKGKFKLVYLFGNAFDFFKDFQCLQVPSEENFTFQKDDLEAYYVLEFCLPIGFIIIVFLLSAGFFDDLEYDYYSIFSIPLSILLTHSLVLILYSHITNLVLLYISIIIFGIPILIGCLFACYGLKLLSDKIVDAL